MKKYIYVLAAAMTLTITACGSKKTETTSQGTTQSQEEPIEAKTLDVPFLAAMPIEGEQADYFAIEGDSVTLTGTPPEGSSTQGTIRATVKIKILKPFPKLDGFGTFPPMTLYFLNSDKEEIQSSRLEMSDADQEIILAELKKSKPGVVEISYTGKFYSSTYNKLFNETAFVQIKSANLSDGSSSSSSSSSSDDSYSSSSSDDSDYDIDDIKDAAHKGIDAGTEMLNEELDKHGALGKAAKKFTNRNAEQLHNAIDEEY